MARTTKSNLNTIASNADSKKETKQKRKPRLTAEEKNKLQEGKSRLKAKKPKKIKQSFINDGDFQYSDKLVLRLVKNGIPISECHRTYSTEITRNANKIGAICVYKEDVLTKIIDVITDETDLVYVVEEVDAETRDKYIKTFGEIVIHSFFQTDIKYVKPTVTR